MCALKNVKEVELMGMPKLKKCVLMGGLKNVKSVKMENAGKLESVKGLKEVVEAERKKREEEEAERKKKEEEERKRREEERKRKEEEDRKKAEEEKRKREEIRRKQEEINKKREEIRRKREEINRRIEEMNAMEKSVIVKGIKDWNTANCNTGVIVIASNCCNEGALHMIDLSRFMNLKELKVGDDCFGNVDEVRLIGLSQLERVVIGQNCFTECKNDRPTAVNAKSHFYLRNCQKLMELKLGRYSFADYSECAIENVPSLEVIEMGQLNEKSANFLYSSLQLKSDSP